MQRNPETPPARPYYRAIRTRPWPRVSWWYSLLFAVPALILLVMGIASIFGSDDPSGPIEVTVTDQATGQPLQGAVVSLGVQQVDTNAEGVAKLQRPESADYIIVQAVGYEPSHGVVDETTKSAQAVALQSSTVSGVLTDSASGQPVAGASITVLLNGEPSTQTATSGADGSWSIQNAPADAHIRIVAEGYETIDVPANQAATVNLTAGFSEPTPAPESAQSPAETEDPEDEPASAVNPANLPAVPEMVRGIYISAHSAANPTTLDAIIQLVNDTELNAVVVDIKEDYVWYDTQVPFFVDVGAVNPIYDIDDVLAKLDEAGIYTIARLVVFKDPIVAEARPDLAVQDDNGGLWRGWQGEAWVNPFFEELWEANILLAEEAAGLGFDEIQYDYVRFPSDGDLNTANFQHEYTMDDRVRAIANFLDASHERINAAGAWLSADVFGIIALYDDDQGIGQYLRDLHAHVDYISPMVYPSHFDSASIYVGDGGVPNDFPYEVIAISMAGALEKMDGDAGKLRPWLQDFSLGGMTAYGPGEVRAQIEAAEDSGVSGWLLWNSGAGTNNAEALNSD